MTRFALGVLVGLYIACCVIDWRHSMAWFNQSALPQRPGYRLSVGVASIGGPVSMWMSRQLGWDRHGSVWWT